MLTEHWSSELGYGPRVTLVLVACSTGLFVDLVIDMIL